MWPFVWNGLSKILVLLLLVVAVLAGFDEMYGPIFWVMGITSILLITVTQCLLNKKNPIWGFTAILTVSYSVATLWIFALLLPR